MVIRVPALIQPVDPRVSSQRPTGCWSASKILFVDSKHWTVERRRRERRIGRSYARLDRVNMYKIARVLSVGQ